MKARAMTKKMKTKVFGNPKAHFKDFCPLCGSRFYGDDPVEVYNLIVKHVDNGYCKKHFRPFDIALADTGEGLKNNP